MTTMAVALDRNLFLAYYRLFRAVKTYVELVTNVLKVSNETRELLTSVWLDHGRNNRRRNSSYNRCASNEKDEHALLIRAERATVHSR